MKKQLPPWLFGLIVLTATLAICWGIGSFTKKSARSSSSGPGQEIKSDKTLPDFSGETSDGKTFRLSDHKGKVVLLNFWATWCGPCKSEIPELIALQNEFGPRGLVIVGLSNDDDLALVKTYNAQAKMNYPLLLTPPEVQGEFGGPESLPTSFLVDRDGKVVWGMAGVSQAQTVREIFAPEIEKLL